MILIIFIDVLTLILSLATFVIGVEIFIKSRGEFRWSALFLSLIGLIMTSVGIAMLVNWNGYGEIPEILRYFRVIIIFLIFLVIFMQKKILRKASQYPEKYHEKKKIPKKIGRRREIKKEKIPRENIKNAKSKVNPKIKLAKNLFRSKSEKKFAINELKKQDNKITKKRDELKKLMNELGEPL